MALRSPSASRGLNLLWGASQFAAARRFSASEPAEQTAKPAPQLPPFDYQPLPYDGPSKAEVLEMRKTFLNPAKFLHFKEPVMIVEGKMQYLFDEKGRRYLDVSRAAATCHRI